MREPELTRQPTLVREAEEPMETTEQLETSLLPEVLPIREELLRPEPREKPPAPLEERETFGFAGLSR